MSTPPRIVITGIGWVTPLGHDIETVWRNLLAGKSGASATTRFDASTFPTTFSSQVTGYDHLPLMKEKALHEGVGLNTSFALGAAAQAFGMSGLASFTGLDTARMGIYLGSGEGSLDSDNYFATNIAGWDEATRTVNGAKWAAVGFQKFNALKEAEQEPNQPLNHIAMEFGAEGPCYNCLTACAASTQAIGEAFEILRRGDADVMIAGGAHTMIHPLGVTGFNRLTALSERNDSPATASRSFSLDRDGFVMGEGAGMLILETLEHAQKRGAKILAEIGGYGSTADAYRITDIHPEGKGAAAAIRQALAQAGLEPKQVDYINAHGTSTKENDSIETKAIKVVFGGRDTAPPVSSIKTSLGHLIAAAGAVEAIACVLAIRDQVLPPTLNYSLADPVCDLDYIPNAPRQAKVEVCLSNSFGFGGQNDTLIIRKFTA